MTTNAVLDSHALTKAGEDYLESIYRLGLDQADAEEGVRSVDVAEQLGVGLVRERCRDRLEDLDDVEHAIRGSERW